MESCIVFIYDKENNNIAPFLKEIDKLYIYDENYKNNPGDDQIGLINKPRSNSKKYDKSTNVTENMNKKNILSELQNIMVITSTICGLGKTEKIKKMIKDAEKKYFHFPLGGIISKSIIYDKLYK